MTTHLTPIAPRERVATLDVLRGIALCGVMIGNMVLYSGRWTTRGAHSAAPEGTRLDQIAGRFQSIFVDSKAQTLLTFLFGFGFAVQLLRAEARQEPVMGLYLRRLGALFVLGLLHITLLWWGDVTWTYAVAGLGLLAFLRTSNRTRVLAGLALIFVPYLVISIPALGQPLGRLFLEPKAFEAHTVQMAAALHRPDRAGLAWEHLQYALVWCSRIYAWYFFWTLGRFLLGYVAGQLRWFDDDGARHLPMFRRMAAGCGATAVVTTTLGLLDRLGYVPLHTYGTAGRLATAAMYQLGLLAATLTYVAIVVLLMQLPPWRRVLRVLAPVGRMPLTTYFSQSLICTFLFYGWGLGWAGSVGVAGGLGLAVAIFSVEVVLCHLWLRYFRFGPLEWLWRSAVYLKLSPMRVS
ncbi:MAG TPA: DUF418 domain-containing protein [Polyangia bacterium]|jgi:uncharacterized protein|nr:DUF418 domain-containing protein [Polyangia bacterium]